MCAKRDGRRAATTVADAGASLESGVTKNQINDSKNLMHSTKKTEVEAMNSAPLASCVSCECLASLPMMAPAAVCIVKSANKIPCSRDDA